MPLIADLRALLGRPPLPPEPVPGPPKSKKRPTDEDQLTSPVTEAELVAALERSTAEREAAEAIIASAGERRAALLMDETADDAIAATGREIGKAQLTLERLDLIEPELWSRLTQTRHNAARAAWIEGRDAYVALARTYLADAREFAEKAGPMLAAANAKRREIAAAFPYADNVLPGVPYLPLAHLDRAGARLQEFSTLLFNPVPRGKPVSDLGWLLSDIPIDEVPVNLREQVEHARRSEVRIIRIGSTFLEDNLVLPREAAWGKLKQGYRIMLDDELEALQPISREERRGVC